MAKPKLEDCQEVLWCTEGWIKKGKERDWLAGTDRVCARVGVGSRWVFSVLTCKKRTAAKTPETVGFVRFNRIYWSLDKIVDNMLRPASDAPPTSRSPTVTSCGCFTPARLKLCALVCLMARPLLGNVKHILLLLLRLLAYGRRASLKFWDSPSDLKTRPLTFPPFFVAPICLQKILFLFCSTLHHPLSISALKSLSWPLSLAKMSY
jgi:hypothetical protein